MMTLCPRRSAAFLLSFLLGLVLLSPSEARADDALLKKIDTEKKSVHDCKSYRKHKSWRVEFGEFQVGDILAIRTKTTLEGDNPVYSHAFECELPVLQSDITIEVPTELFEKFGPGWHWWKRHGGDRRQLRRREQLLHGWRVAAVSCRRRGRRRRRSCRKSWKRPQVRRTDHERGRLLERWQGQPGQRCHVLRVC